MRRSAVEFAAVLSLSGMAAAAAAQTPMVNSARASGAVGERYDGYLGIAATVPSAVRVQVNTINIRRRSLYSNLAAAKGATPQAVGITAGCELLARVAVGEAYLWADGGWRRREPNQPPPVPDYCR
ncbi:YdbL family protein [Sphingomonas sp.]|uniref:YdbL family protein n=1 Tax=Sphingomonas sp. TaxID=28214 RepID=UPI0038A03026